MDPTVQAFADSLSSAFARAYAAFEDVRIKVQSVGGYVTEGAAGFQPLVDNALATVIAFREAKSKNDLQSMRRLLASMEAQAISARRAFIGDDGESTVGVGAAAEDAADAAKEAAGDLLSSAAPWIAIALGIALFGAVFLYGPRRQ